MKSSIGLLSQTSVFGKFSSVLFVGVKALCLGKADKGDNETEDRDTEEDPEDVLSSEGFVAEVSEEQGSQDGTTLSAGGRETVSSGSDSGGEDFSRVQEGGGVGSEVEEELQEDEEGEDLVGVGLVVVELSTQDSKEESVHSESHQLNGLSSNDVDEGNGEEVTGQETSDSDDQVSGSSLHQLSVCGRAGGESNGAENGRLVQVDTVEGNIDQEPAHGSTEQSEGVLGLGEVGEEFILGLLSNGGQFETDGLVFEVDVDIGFRSLLEVVVVGFFGNNDTGSTCLVEEFRVILDGTSLGKSGGFDQSQSEVENGKGRDEGETLHDSPSTRKLVTAFSSVE